MEQKQDFDRPNPQALLEALERDKRRQRGGRLFLFIGMAPGVGKTYAMLNAAKEASLSGHDVVIGVVECHGRQETIELSKNIESIPKRAISYRDVILYEMDIDALLKRKPKIALVDELAHSNVPGSRHAKRWQDVIELLDAGIDVYSTINVQHLESRKEAVEQIAHIRILETVPDILLDRAYQIRLIDLSPSDLLKRLKEGKVYLGEKAELAAQHFFEEHKLTALREIALRLTAEKVNVELQHFNASAEDNTALKASDALMLVLETEGCDEYTIRQARNLAYALNAYFLVVYIDKSPFVSQKSLDKMRNLLDLSKNLGADILHISQLNAAHSIQSIARQKGINYIAMSTKSKGLVRALRPLQTQSLVLLNSNSRSSPIKDYIAHLFRAYSPFRNYLKPIALIAVLSILNFVLVPFFEYRLAGLLYLVAIVALGPFVSMGPLILTALLASFFWNYFFVPPTGTLYMASSHDIFLCISYFLCAFVLGFLTRRIHQQRLIVYEREKKSRLLHDILIDISSIHDQKEMLSSISKRLSQFMQGKCQILLKRKHGGLKNWTDALEDTKEPEKEMAVATWCLDNQKIAGSNTNTLSAARGTYFPLKGISEIVGVIAFFPKYNQLISANDMDLLSLASHPIAISLERELLREKAEENNRLKEAERAQRTIIDFLSSELKKPLLDLDSLLRAYENPNQLLLLSAAENLNLIIDDLISLSQLSAGTLQRNDANYTTQDLILNLQKRLPKNLLAHPLHIKDECPQIKLKTDAGLFGQALANVIIDTLSRNEKISSLFIHVSLQEGALLWSISNQNIESPLLLRQNSSEKSLKIAVARKLFKSIGAKLSFYHEEGFFLARIRLPLS